MPFVVTLYGFLPPARFDVPPVPWTAVEVYQGDTPLGPWTLIDTITLPNPDPDPTVPAVRNITTTQATTPGAWYQVVFLDDDGGQSEPSDPVRNTADGEALPPSPDDLRTISPLLRQNFPLPPTDAYQIADLRNVTYQATALVQAATWRLIDPTLGDAAPEGYVSEAVPPALVPVALQAIARMAERLDVTSAPDLAEQIATGRRLRGFSAGPYSENYFDPGQFARRGVSARPTMDNDDALDTALWALATEDARDYAVWRQSGIAPPTGLATTFDYRRQSLGYAAGGGGMAWGGGYGHGGPDGF